MMSPNHDDIVHRLTNHPPSTVDAANLLDTITDNMITLGFFLISRLPESREKSVSLTKLEECSMWAKAAVARNQE